jgi:hypothetical protein
MTRLTPRGWRVLTITCCLAGFALGMYAPLWDAMPWAVTP